MNCKQYIYILITLLFLFNNSSHALSVGEQAPPLQVRSWLKAGPVELAKGLGKNIYVVEFWATWCPPCRQTIPHLSELQKDYKDSGVIIIGISSEQLTKVENFVKKQQNMNYSIAVDEQRKTTKAYMATETNIPFCFVINKEGKVAWKGHPLDLDRVLKKVIDGTFDAALQNKISGLRSKLQLSLQTGNEADIVKYADHILSLDPENSFALGLRLSLFERKRQTAEALKFVSALLDRCPNNKALYFVKLNLLGRQLDNSGDLRGFANQVLRRFNNDPVALNQLAWMLMNNLPFGQTPLQVALSAAQIAVDKLPAGADKSQSTAFYATLARAFYMVGKYQNSLEEQQRAIDFAKGSTEEKAMKQLLEFYKRALKLNQTK